MTRVDYEILFAKKSSFINFHQFVEILLKISKIKFSDFEGDAIDKLKYLIEEMT